MSPQSISRTPRVEGKSVPRSTIAKDASSLSAHSDNAAFAGTLKNLPPEGNRASSDIGGTQPKLDAPPAPPDVGARVSQLVLVEARYEDANTLKAAFFPSSRERGLRDKLEEQWGTLEDGMKSEVRNYVNSRPLEQRGNRISQLKEITGAEPGWLYTFRSVMRLTGDYEDARAEYQRLIDVVEGGG